MQLLSLLLLSFLSVNLAYILHKDLYLLDYTIHNNFNYTIKVLREGTPFGDFAGYLKVEFDGNLLPYEGALGTYDNRPEAAYLILEPEESKTVRFYLEDNFNLSRSGKYHAWFEKSKNSQHAKCQKKVFNNFLQDKAAQNETEYECSEDPEEIFVLANLSKTNSLLNQIINPTSSWNNSALPEKYPSYANFSFVKETNGSIYLDLVGIEGGVSAKTPYETAILRRFKDMDHPSHPISKFIEKALQQFQESAFPPLYVRWFDWKAWNFTNFTRRDEVQNRFIRMKSILHKVTLNLSDTDKFRKCLDSNTLTYVKTQHHPNVVFLCDRFFEDYFPYLGSFPLATNNRGIGLVYNLLHELAHLAGVTLGDPGIEEDYSYENCLMLAELNPKRAVKNAQNYKFFFRSLPVDVEISSIYGYGLRAENTYIYSDNQVSSNLVFECIGEFPECELREKQSGKYLGYRQNVATPDKMRLDGRQTKWKMEYVGNGAWKLTYSGQFWDSEVTMDGNQMVEDFGTTSNYPKYWIVGLNGNISNTRVVTIQDFNRGGIFKSQNGLKDDSDLKCNQNAPGKNLNLILMGPLSQFLLRAKGTGDLFLNTRAFPSDRVYLSKKPNYWKYTQNEDQDFYTLRDQESWYPAGVFCSGTRWNPDFVYADSWYEQKTILYARSVGELGLSEENNILTVDS